MSFELNAAPLRAVELFAGVGGFRLGLEGREGSEHQPTGDYKVVWSNQWEPRTTKQHASDVYVQRWGTSGHSNQDIFEVLDSSTGLAELASSRPDIVVGGFPCQDFSVARAASEAKGLEGRKGVLWWAVYRVLEELGARDRPARYVMLENVDRLLQSPAACRGRDFAIILSSLARLGYAVEWRVINAGDYGWPQRRKRIFIMAYHKTTAEFERLRAGASAEVEAVDWLCTSGIVAAAFPAVCKGAVSTLSLEDDPVVVQQTYKVRLGGRSVFGSAGMMVDGRVWTTDVVAAALEDYSALCGQARPRFLGDIVAETTDVPEEYFLGHEALARWTYLKGAKSAPRVSASGYAYTYSEGPVTFPDALDRPSRTVITGEGGSAASRTKHVIQTLDGRLRRLTPEELEQLNGFPRGFTKAAGVSDAKRAFLMGNALVVGIVRRLGQSLAASRRLSVGCRSAPHSVPAPIDGAELVEA